MKLFSSGRIKNMSICADFKPQCRVDLPRISTPGHPGGECALVPGKIGDIGSKKYVTPYNVIYHEPGTIIRNWNHRGLRLPQKQAYLAPEFYNSGCSTLYGSSKFDNGPNSATSNSASTNAMYDTMFSSMPYNEGNNVSCACGSCGTCKGYNSSAGWMVEKNGKLAWENQALAQQQAYQQSCQQVQK